MTRLVLIGGCLLAAASLVGPAGAQVPSETDAALIREKLAELTTAVEKLKAGRDDVRPVADVEVFAKAADWIMRHNEFHKPDYAKWTIEILETGLERARNLGDSRPGWYGRPGSTVLGYYSEIDGSVQPFAVRLPHGYDPKAPKRWPLHVELHGRGETLNEVSFIHAHENKPLKGDSEYIQLDVFGRTNNAYRWAGESDVLEAMAATKRLFRIDDRRVTLRGFSMGGAGAWHLGLHRPSLWSSVGAGAGFCDTVHHLGLKEPLSPLHQKMTRIYDAQDYALNAFNVPTIGYGGELDKQIFASKTMHERGEELGVPILRLIGPKTEHKWHPDSLKEFMAFHAAHTAAGRPHYPAPNKIRFVTFTLKYNTTDWLTIEEQIKPYEASIVEAEVDGASDTLKIATKNISVLQIMRDVAATVEIDGGKPLVLGAAAGGLLPGVYFEKREDGWVGWDYIQSHKYAAHDVDGDEPRKRHNLQGPIDDAFMGPFVCVRPTGVPWSATQNDWAKWTLARFEREFDKWMRGRVPVVNDTQVTDELIETKNLILFGDPGSNAVLARVVGRLPVTWTKTGLEVNGTSYDPATHGVALIYPNPLNPNRYVVVNSGHTFHEADFKASNANLYPKLGDIAVLKFSATGDGFSEEPVFADVFDSRWRLGDPR
jgi:dienelactone hydrolase